MKRLTNCHECPQNDIAPEKRVLRGNMVFYRYTCPNCGECYEQTRFAAYDKKGEIEVISENEIYINTK